MPTSSENIAVSIRGLGKAYRIARNSRQHSTLAEAIVDRVRYPFRREQRETFWALRDVSAEIRRGEVVGIIGQNGAGKSTLLKILSRITEPTAGEIDLYGRVGSLLEVGTGFHRELTGRENIYLNGAILGMTRREIGRRFEEIVEFSGVERFLDTPVKRYSSGMYVRLAFAVAAHLQPEILIVDEVLAVGDAAFQKKCLGKMQDVARGGRTVLFVSHNMTAVRQLCSRVIWLQSGAVRADGRAGETIDMYADAVGERRLDRKNVAELPRPAGLGQQLRIVGVTFNGGGPILHGEALEAEFEFETRQEISDAVFGFGFANIDGVRIVSCDSDVPGQRIDLPSGIRGSIRVRVDEWHLQPGQYLLQMGARTGPRLMLDLIDDSLLIDVLPGPSTPDVIIGQRAGVRMPGQWICEGIRHRSRGDAIPVSLI